MDVYPISFNGPVEEPVRIANGQVDTSMGLGITKACPPVSAVQRARAIEVHCPRDVIEIIKIRGVVVAHGLGFFFLKDLEETGARPKGSDPLATVAKMSRLFS
jgi:hypothetical protein